MASSSSPPPGPPRSSVHSPVNGTTESSSPYAWLLDAALALGLGGMLLVVYIFDLATANWFQAPPNAIGKELVDAGLPAGTSRVKRLRLAVTPQQFDDMGRLLNLLGDGYRYDDLPLEDLGNIDTLQRYDVIFLTCGGTPDYWEFGGGPAGRGRDELTRSLRAYVEQGGTLYASDWRIQILQIVFPELIQSGPIATGTAQEMTADVVDEGLRDVIGPTIHLHFDLGGWYPAAFQARDAKTYLAGSYASTDGSRAQSPLLVKVPVGRGAIVYTSFHNEKQNSATELELLKYLVFTTVTARAQQEAQQSIVQGGFSPAKQNLLSTSSQNPTVSSSYQHAQAGPLVFVLAFENQGARLRLEVTGPDGRTTRQEGVETLKVELADATAGTWKYTVTALEVPFENFPFTVTIGAK